MCQAYNLPRWVGLVSRASWLLEDGVIGLDDIDLWTLEAVESDRAERGRIQRLRIDQMKDRP